MTGADEPTPKRTSAAPPVWALTTLGIVLLIAIGSSLVRDDPEPSDGSSQTPTATATADATDTPAESDAAAVELTLPAARSSARCFPVDETTVANVDLAFDGTVTTLTDDTVTLAVRQWYTGGDAAEVTLDVREVPPTLAGYFDFAEGERYVVSANGDGVVMVCGFSAPYDAELAGIFERAFAD